MSNLLLYLRFIRLFNRFTILDVIFNIEFTNCKKYSLVGLSVRKDDKVLTLDYVSIPPPPTTEKEHTGCKYQRFMNTMAFLNS